MPRLELRLQTLKTSEAKLNEALIGFEMAGDEKKNSIIKRFESFYEIAWKFFKDVLEQQQIDAIPSPKKVFLRCEERGLITPQEAALLLEATDDRINLHYTFDEATSMAFARKIKHTYYPALHAIIQRLVHQ